MPIKAQFRIAAAVVAAGLGLGSVATLASNEDLERNESSSEIREALTARTASADAVKAAETAAGGRAVEFGLENRDGKLDYEDQVATATGMIKNQH